MKASKANSVYRQLSTGWPAGLLLSSWWPRAPCPLRLAALQLGPTARTQELPPWNSQRKAGLRSSFRTLGRPGVTGEDTELPTYRCSLPAFWCPTGSSCARTGGVLVARHFFKIFIAIHFLCSPSFFLSTRSRDHTHKVTMSLKMTLNSWFFCLQLTNTTGMGAYQ